MASYKSVLKSGLLLVIVILSVQSAPIDKDKQVQLPSEEHKKVVDKDVHKFVSLVKATAISTSTTTNPTTTVSLNSLSTSTIPTASVATIDHKKKRFISDDEDNDNDDLDELVENQNDENDELDSSQLPYFKYGNEDDHIDRILHPTMKEISSTNLNNADKSINIDDSRLYTESKMTSNQLTDIVRRRRDVKLNNELNTRRKRALSNYDFYDSDSFDDEPYIGLIQRYQYIRPTRSFAPLYWYPTVYQRNVRAALIPSLYDTIDYPKFYSNPIDSNDFEENPSPLYIDDDDDDDNNNESSDDEDEYESVRYPDLLSISTNPWNNFELEKKYRRDYLPIDGDFEESSYNLNDEDENNVDNNDDGVNDDDDDDDDDSDNEVRYRVVYETQHPYYNRYEPIETYF